MTAIVLIGGTWANKDGHDCWWKLGSPFYERLTALGYKPCYSYAWDTELDGVIGADADWEHAGERLKQVCPQNATVVTHSHGGQVVAYAAAKGLAIKRLVTIATPIRPDVPYAAARKSIGYWTHIYGNYMDYLQIAGEVMLGRFWKLRRQMPDADENIFYPANHQELHSVAVWNEKNWWVLL